MEYWSRKNIRLRGYDYSQAGGYYLTICTEGRRNILSKIIPGNKFVRPEIQLSELGYIADKVLMELSAKSGCEISSCVIMPNHIHLILRISGTAGATTVGQFVGMFKSLTLHHWRKICNERGTRMGKVWQRNFYEHILRNEADYLEKLRYIDENPDSWLLDEHYSEN